MNGTSHKWRKAGVILRYMEWEIGIEQRITYFKMKFKTLYLK